jgi:hypothetical protein
MPEYVNVRLDRDVYDRCRNAFPELSGTRAVAATLHEGLRVMPSSRGSVAEDVDGLLAAWRPQLLAMASARRRPERAVERSENAAPTATTETVSQEIEGNMDYTACCSAACPSRLLCFRFRGVWSRWQSMSDFSDSGESCREFLPIEWGRSKVVSEGEAESRATAPRTPSPFGRSSS